MVKKDIDENIIYVSKGYQPEAQMKDELVMRDMHWITLNPYETKTPVIDVENDEASVLFKIRHVAELRSGRLSQRADGSYYLKMDQKTNGVAPGQFCVIYTPDGCICLGSGEIAWD